MAYHNSDVLFFSRLSLVFELDKWINKYIYFYPFNFLWNHLKKKNQLMETWLHPLCWILNRYFVKVKLNYFRNYMLPITESVGGSKSWLMVLGDVLWCTEKLLCHCLLCLCIYTPLLGLHFVSLPLQVALVTGDCWTGGLKIKPIWTQSLNVPIIIFQLTLFLPTASRGQISSKT